MKGMVRLISLEISAMDQAIEEVSERDGQSYLSRDLCHGPGHRGGEYKG